VASCRHPAPPDRSEAEAASDELPERYYALLLCLGAAFIVVGIVPGRPWERGAVTLLLGGTLLLSFWAAHMPARHLRLAAVLVGGGIAVVFGMLLAGESDVAHGASALVSALLVAAAPPAVVAGLLRTLRARRAVTLDAVFGVLCLYLLLGMCFAFLYAVIDHFGGRPVFANGLPATPSRCLYFSFATLTTVGYGDLSARTDLGHTVSVLEALMGQLYIVTVVAVIVGNLAPPPARTQLTRRPRR
jgi:Ion channel